MTISELLQLRNKLSEEKRVIDRKLFIVKNLIRTSFFIRDHKSRQKKSKTLGSSSVAERQAVNL